MRYLSQTLLAAALAFALSGCAVHRDSGIGEYYRGEIEEARAIYEENRCAEPSSRALYSLRLGTLELDEGNITAARDHFIDATGSMMNFEAEGEFKAIVGAEASKEYKGDPYEQMMALWFLGLTDYMLGDYTKALPSFRSAALADGGTTEERYRSDAASVFVMLGKTYRAYGDEQKARLEFGDAAGVYTYRQTVERVSSAVEEAGDAVLDAAGEPRAAQVAYSFLYDGVSAGASLHQDPVDALSAAREHAFEALQKAAESRRSSERLGGEDPNVIGGYIRELYSAAAAVLDPGIASGKVSPLEALVAEASNPENNFLVIIGLGRGPYKSRAGQYGERVEYGRRRYPERHAEVLIDGQPVGCTRTIEDIYYQASTRGGRAMDSILASKAVFKELSGTAAKFALSEGLRKRRSNQREWLVAGAALTALSVATQPQADIRSWETLPDKIQVLSVAVPPGNHTVTVRFHGKDGPIDAMTREFKEVGFPSNGETLLYVRSGRKGVVATPKPMYEN